MGQGTWADGDAYEAYVGRWSRQVAAVFLRWLDVPAGRRWLDVGCGTGALTATILATADPGEVVGVDSSEKFLDLARARIADKRVTLHVGDARSLPLPDGCFDAVVSGLALNFVPESDRAVAELARVAAPGAIAAAYVWDYADGMEMMRIFWQAAKALDPAAADVDESLRFAFCRAEPLRDLWLAAGLADVVVEAVEIPTIFTDFDDFWSPFLGGQGPAPSYLVAQSEDRQSELRELVRSRLPVGPDGSIPLTAKAWAVRGVAN